MEWYEQSGPQSERQDSGNNQNMNGNGYGYVPRPRDSFATAALVCGFLSCVLIMTGILPIPAGALGIIFALLASRKGQPKVKSAKTGLTLSIIGMVMGVFLTAYTMYEIMYDTEFQKQLDAVYSQIYGGDMTFEQFLEQNGMNGLETR